MTRSASSGRGEQDRFSVEEPTGFFSHKTNRANTQDVDADGNRQIEVRSGRVFLPTKPSEQDRGEQDRFFVKEQTKVFRRRAEPSEKIGRRKFSQIFP